MNPTFSRRTDLALSALGALAREPGRKLTREVLASRVGTTSSYLPQVIAPLVRAGWIVSERGPGGGYRLHRSAFGARLLEVLEAVEGPVRNRRCILRGGPCPESECQVHEVWAEARRVMIDGFGEMPVLTSQGECR